MAQRSLSRERLGSRRFSPLFQLLGAFAIVAVAWFVAPRLLRRFEFFRIRRVEIAGLHYLAPAKVIKALELDSRASVFDDLAGSERRLRAVPGIRSAELRSRMPGTLEIRVHEALPVALAPGPAGMMLLDSSGTVLPFDPAASAPDLPVAGNADATVARVLASVLLTDAALFGRVRSARRVQDDVVLDYDGHRLWFGPAVTAEDIRAVMAVAQDLARQGRSYQELDGRFAGQVIVRRAGA